MRQCGVIHRRLIGTTFAERFPKFVVDHITLPTYKSNSSSPMTTTATYPIHPQTTAWSRCAGMFPCVGKPGSGYGQNATEARTSRLTEDLSKEADR